MVLCLEQLGAPGDHRNQRYAGRGGHPYRSGLEFLDLKRTTNRRLGENPDDFAGSRVIHRRVEGDFSVVPVHADVVERTHQRAGNAVFEGLLLGHEPYKTLTGLGPEAVEDDVDVTDVIGG